MIKSLGLLVVAMCACGDNHAGPSDSRFADSPVDTAARTDARVDAEGGMVDAPLDAFVPRDASDGTFQLTVNNYAMWCSVGVNGGTPTNLPQQIVHVLPGTIPLTATPASSIFEIGTAPWHHTDGDTVGAGEQGTVTGSGATAQSAVNSTITNAAKCVWVCCPFTDGSGCPILDQCL